MSLKRRVQQIEQGRSDGSGIKFSAIFMCEWGGSGGKDEEASAKLLIGPHAGEEITKTNTETYAEFKERVEKLLHPEGRTDAERESDIKITIGGDDPALKSNETVPEQE